MLQRPLSAAQVQAFNQRGSLLADSKSVLRLTLQGGEMFWVDNRKMAHNRISFVDNPATPRTMVGMWRSGCGR
jgi:alpha-ketoglutarate-dependent taurine dioxygenase